MPKTLPPGTVELPSGPFQVNVLPDVFDDRDLEYRPRLSPLPSQVDVRPGDRHVMTQVGNSCTGHAMAAMINAVLAARPDPIKVSPYMLYRMARRYDEWEGEADEGSSLRGALKGWFNHGVLPVEDWPELDEGSEPDIDLDPDLANRAMSHPLGAFYRVNAFRLDDLQSAVNELHGIVASAAVHSGWVTPTEVTRGDTSLHVIERPVDAIPLGGHAFAIVGYNEVGFLVQNSWGVDWGKGGFATLPYDDWLKSAYDAWVARPGVRSIGSSMSRTQLVEDTAGGLATGPGPDLVRLQRHVVNLGNNGTLSSSGRFRSSPAQVDNIFTRMKGYHEQWRTAMAGDGETTAPPRRIVLYAHGGLNSEGTGLTIAQKQLNWWLNNHVYPITFAWQSGPVESLLDHLSDTMRGRLPAGGIGIDLVEQFDRLVERFARSHISWMWEEMKENAAAASRPLPEDVRWPTDGAPLPAEFSSLPGASLTLERLATYIHSVPEEKVEVHLVGHSAGSIFLTAMLTQFQTYSLPVTTLSFLAPALRASDFESQVLPLLRNGFVQNFSSFGLADRRELDDVCGAKGVPVYQKSLLYLVARALERSGDGGRQVEVPLLGMQRFGETPIGRSSLRQAVQSCGRAELIWAPSHQPPRSRSDSMSHGGFDDDAATMTSVLLRVLGHQGEPTRRMGFEPNSPLLDPGVEDPQAVRPRAGAAEIAHDAGEVPVTQMAAPQPGGVDVPPVHDGPLPEERVAPRATSPVKAALLRDGWRSTHQ